MNPFIIKLEEFFYNSFSEFSDVVSPTFSCPAPPTLTLVNSNCNQTTISWNDYPAGIEENGYTIYRVDSQNPLNYYELANLNANVTQHTIYNYSNYQNQTFTYFIAGNFKSTKTNLSNGITPTLNCNPVQNLKIVTVDCQSITLNWDPSLADNYTIYRSKNGANGDYDYVTNIYNYNKTNVISYVDNGSSFGNLFAGSTYHYKIKSNFYSGSSAFSEPVSATINCNSPSNLVVASTSCGKINLKWDNFPDVINETGYEVYKSTNGANGEYYRLVNLGSDVTFFTDNGNLNVESTYYYKVKALFGSITTDYTNAVSATFSCSIPTNLRVSETNCGKIKLEWDDVENEKNYRIYRSFTSNGYYQPIGSTSKNILTYNDGNNITAGQTYFYKIQALIENTYTKFSNTVSASFSCEVPTGLKIDSTNCNGVYLSWTPKAGVEKYYLYRSDYENGDYYLASLLPNNNLTSGIDNFIQENKNIIIKFVTNILLLFYLNLVM